MSSQILNFSNSNSQIQHSKSKLSNSPNFLLTMSDSHQVTPQASTSAASATNSMHFSTRSEEIVNLNKTFIFITLLWHPVFTSALYEY